MEKPPEIAYFSMEIGLESGMPTYSGGLGVLAGDTIRAAADLAVPMAAMTLLHRHGYCFQRLDHEGRQTEEPTVWQVDDFCQALPATVTVTIEGRAVQIRAWKYEVHGVAGFTVPVFLLDTDLPANTAWDRTLTHDLYGGDLHYRLCQEAVLGIGGLKMLNALGFTGIKRFHMNEGHSSLLTLELLDEEAAKAGRSEIVHADVLAARERCVFTTHTPVPAGHDQFPMDLVRRVLGERQVYSLKEVFSFEDKLNMTYLALNLSGYVNGVAKKHGEVSRLMFASYHIDSITNGVHAGTWASPAFQALFDKYISGWRQDNFTLRSALGIPKQEVWQAHVEAKKALFRYIFREHNVAFDIDLLTLGFARRAAAYKRADLLFTDLDRLRRIAKTQKLQIIYAGKAHPQDQQGKEVIERIFQFKAALQGDVPVIYLPNYDMELGKLMTAGVDVWLNTPEPPLEASGTSGMKAALNGVPSFSVLDGWWIEGCIEDVTGWAIGKNGRSNGAGHHDDHSADAASLYEKLEHVIAPLFYTRRDEFLEVMRHAIALNGSFFNTHRMMQQYVLNAYFQ